MNRIEEMEKNNERRHNELMQTLNAGIIKSNNSSDNTKEKTFVGPEENDIER